MPQLVRLAQDAVLVEPDGCASALSLLQDAWRTVRSGANRGWPVTEEPLFPLLATLHLELTLAVHRGGLLQRGVQH